MRTLTLSEKGLCLIGIPLVCQLVLLGVLHKVIHDADAEIARVDRAKEVVAVTDRIVENIIRGGEVVMRMNPTTNRKKASKYLDQLVESTESDLGKLKNLVRGNKKEEQLVARASAVEEKLTGLLNEARKYAEGDGSLLEGLDVFRHMHDKMQPTLEELASDMRQLITEEEEIASRKPEVQESSQKNVGLAMIVIVLVDLVLALAMWLFFNRSTADRLRVLMDNTMRLAQEKPLNKPLEGNDELAQLDHRFNDMAKSLAAAMHKERAIIENARDVICAMDEDGNFISLSQACTEEFGYLPNMLVDQNWIAVIGEKDEGNALEYAAAIKSGQKRPPLETSVRKQDGSFIDVMWSMNWSETERHFFCVVHNVTARKMVERMKQEFVAMVSHDLRTPLTSVQACLALLETGTLGELNADGRQCVTAADANINRLVSLVNDLLDVEKMQSGKLELLLRPTHIEEVVERTLHAVTGFAAQQSIELKTEIEDGLFAGDGDRLVQVLVNLVSNAVKFSEPHSAVTIAAHPLPEEDLVEFKVIDQGRGIPADMLDAVFERFQQVAPSDDREKKGSGLGLAICKAIVESHRGTIGVDSEVGTGSTFWLRIPKGDTEQRPTIVSSGTAEVVGADSKSARD